MSLTTEDIFSGHPRIVNLRAGTHNLSSKGSVNFCVKNVLKMCSVIQDLAISGEVY